MNLITAGLAAIERAALVHPDDPGKGSAESGASGKIAAKASRVYATNANGSQITLKIPREEVEGQSLDCLL